jgi:hypothetical protein
MLESTRNGADFSNTDGHRVRKTWTQLLRSLYNNVGKIPGRLFRLGKPGVSGGLDEKVPIDVSIPNNQIMEEKIEKTREEVFQDSHFEWVKTERQGDVCRFKEFYTQDGVEYVVFLDSTRVRLDLIGDVVLQHQHEGEILGDGLVLTQTNFPPSPLPPPPVLTMSDTGSVKLVSKEIDPVSAILEKTKKKTEKVSLTLTLKIPAPELYNVIKENFDNAEEVLLQNVMDQIHDNLLREALKRELQNIYQKKKRNNAGSV